MCLKNEKINKLQTTRFELARNKIKQISSVSVINCQRQGLNLCTTKPNKFQVHLFDRSNFLRIMLILVKYLFHKFQVNTSHKHVCKFA